MLYYSFFQDAQGKKKGKSQKKKNNKSKNNNRKANGKKPAHGGNDLTAKLYSTMEKHKEVLNQLTFHLNYFCSYSLTLYIHRGKNAFHFQYPDDKLLLFFNFRKH